MVVIAVLVILFAPMASALLNVSENQWDVEICTESEYDLTWMDASCLSSNLTEAMDGKAGCRVIYGDYSEDLSASNVQSVSEKVISSGATSARAVDSEGKTLTQERITYRNSVAERTVMDISIPDIITKISSIDLVIGYEGSGLVIPASSANAIEGNVIRADFTVPYILKYAALAYGCDEYVGIHINYESNMEFDIDVKTDIEDQGYRFATKGNDLDIISGVPVGKSISGSVGGYTGFSIADGVLEIDGRNTAPSDSIKNSLANNPITIASESTSVTLTDETAKALIELLEALETKAGGFHRCRSTASRSES